jgi:hypothetical protein
LTAKVCVPVVGLSTALRFESKSSRPFVLLDGDKDGVGCEGSGVGNGNNNDGNNDEDSTPANECQGQADCFRGTVTMIVDGDTIDINNVRIRLALVNTPERGESGYTEAIDFVESICGVGTTALVDEDDGHLE